MGVSLEGSYLLAAMQGNIASLEDHLQIGVDLNITDAEGACIKASRLRALLVMLTAKHRRHERTASGREY